MSLPFHHGNGKQRCKNGNERSFRQQFKSYVEGDVRKSRDFYKFAEKDPATAMLCSFNKIRLVFHILTSGFMQSLEAPNKI